MQTMATENNLSLRYLVRFYNDVDERLPTITQLARRCDPNQVSLIKSIFYKYCDLPLTSREKITLMRSEYKKYNLSNTYSDHPLSTGSLEKALNSRADKNRDLSIKHNEKMATRIRYKRLFNKGIPIEKCAELLKVDIQTLYRINTDISTNGRDR